MRGTLRMRGTLGTSVVLAGALVLTACGGQERATFEEAEPIRQAQAADAPGDDAEGDDGSATTQEPDDTEQAAEATEGGPRTGPSTVPDLVPIEWPDAPRELTEVEQQFMFEPGPFAGDAYDEDAAFEAILAMNPQTEEEWQRAIQSQIQGDYAEDLKAAITFDPSLGEGIAEPTEGHVEAPEEVVGTNHFALVLDASGSMGEASGTGTRMDEAKQALEGFVDTLPADATVSLRVYGHEGDNTNAGKQVSCASTDTVYAGPVDTAEFAAQLAAVEPTGWTPLASAISASARDIPDDATDGIVYVVTDGAETCDGDPVAAAEELAGEGIQPIVNVIGFQADDADQAALAAIAEAGGGEYTQVDSLAELEDYWDEEYSRMMTAWQDWRRAELDRIQEAGTTNQTLAQEVGQRLQDGVVEEGRRGQDLAKRVREQESVDYGTGVALWNHFYSRRLDMWNYAYSTRTANWNAAYSERVGAWREAYALGTAKWSEYYSKKLGN